ncbi:hypothetical protein [Alicyclobacillus macrosporangiidus]|jgi:hypothetical protein|uniref:Uncharacterized protein n=1 Tax=Alicyclobacillus macrosporangiidus TaxID=392015 RepID=A0A1I7HV22_9BACL|nr:hypothetical protein [Alicyclobacillus macrosporangiidus]SFU64491.1 hypothetical protein SAMN05421543_105116 [Alicyclobacillus macrosporangiidus]
MIDRRQFRCPDAPPVKVAFSDLDSLLDELLQCGIRTARLDLFRVIRQSELSFVHYVTWTLYVTAWDPERGTLYEYQEAAGTTVSTDPLAEDAVEPLAPRQRLETLRRRMQEQSIEVRRGRFVIQTDGADG